MKDKKEKDQEHLPHFRESEAFPTLQMESKLLRQIPHIRYGFGTSDSSVPPLFEEEWSTRRPLFKQVHKTAIACITSPSQEAGEVDGFFTESLFPIGIASADCAPLLFAEKEGKAVAALHAGWRGTYAGIVSQFVDLLHSKGEHPSRWVAVIGPTIGPCCYEVSEELAEDFKKRFDEKIGKTIAVPRFRILDLPSIHRESLKMHGFSDVECIPLCTFCSQDPMFRSYRRNPGEKGRQFSIIQKR